MRKLCVHGDSELILEDGSVVKIRDLIEDVNLFEGILKGKIKVLSYSEGKAKFSRILGIYKIPSEKKVVRIRTESGLIAELTRDHEVLISTTEGLRWVEASKLKEGDWVLTPFKVPTSERGKYNDHSVKVSLMMNDGPQATVEYHYSKEPSGVDGSIILSGFICRLMVEGLCEFRDGAIRIDKTVLPKFVEFMEASESILRLKSEDGRDSVLIQEGSILEVLGELGILDGSMDGLVRMPNPHLIEFVKGYLTPDLERFSRGDEALRIPVSGYFMGKRFHYIMKRIGLVSSLKAADGNFYLLLDEDGTKGLIHLIKRTNLKTDPSDDLKEFDSKRLLPLHAKRMIVDALKDGDFVLKREILESIDIEHPDRPISKGELVEVLRRIEDKVPQDRIMPLKKLLESQFYVERILDVEEVDEEEDFVYDITVEGTHNFVLNCDFVVKNCHDIGLILGCGAHMTELRRTRSGPFKEGEDMVTLQDIADAYFIWKNEGDESLLRRVIKPIEYAVQHLPKIVIRDSAVDAICHGADLAAPGVLKVDTGIGPNDLVAILTLKGELVALARAKFSTTKILKMNKGIVADIERVIMKPGTYPPWYFFKSKKQ
ncbi:MAG: PUA domain-containing protein [Candidatus Asgardarchaeia archaeon]